MEDYRYIELSDQKILDQLKITSKTFKKWTKRLIDEGVLEFKKEDGKKIKKFNYDKLKELV